jgi:hypothetical protein
MKMVTTEITDMKREPTSINVDPELWREVKHAVIDLDMNITEFFDQALRNELARVKGSRKK